MALTPFLMLAQYACRSSALGKRQLMPTIAMGLVLLLMACSSCLQKLAQLRRGAMNQSFGDYHHAAVLGLLEMRAARPFVEGSHRRAAPDLVIHHARGLACIRPARTQSEVAAEHQRHPVLRIALRALHLPRIARQKILPRPAPALVDRGTKKLLFNECLIRF